MSKGTYIVIEGPEGVGKTTQLRLLEERLQSAGLPVRAFYESDSFSDISTELVAELAHAGQQPLTDASKILLNNAVRAQSLQAIKANVEQGDICLVNRSYLSTLATYYYGQGSTQDYDTINRIISFAVNGREPDLCVVLDAPVQTLVDRLGKRRHAGRSDAAFFERVRAGYLWEAKQRGFPVVYVTDSATETADAIWQLVSEVLNSQSRSAASSQPTPLKDILEAKDFPIPHEPPIGVLPPEALTGAAELTTSTTGHHIASHAVSYVLAEQLECAVQPYKPTAELRYHPLPDSAINYQFYIPDTLHETLRGQYTATIIEILSLHTRMAQKLTQYLGRDGQTEAVSGQVREALRGVLPAAVERTVDVRAMHEQSDAISTLLHRTGLAEARGFVSQPQSVVNTASKVQTLAESYLAPAIAAESDAVTLASYTPRNELDLVPAIIYRYSDKPIEQVGREVSTWSYDLKKRVLETHLQEIQGGQRNDAALATALYSWDVMSDFATYLTFQQASGLQLVRQQLTPRFGYQTPAVVEEAGAADEYDHCFDLSLQLYSQLQQAGYMAEAEYATLLGHRMRWSFTITAGEMLGLYRNETITDERGLRSLLQSFADRLQEAHAGIASHLQRQQLATTVDNLLTTPATGNNTELQSVPAEMN